MYLIVCYNSPASDLIKIIVTLQVCWKYRPRNNFYSLFVCIIPYCMFRPLFVHLQVEYTVLVFGNYYNRSVVNVIISKNLNYIFRLKMDKQRPKHVAAVRNNKIEQLYKLLRGPVFPTNLIIHATGCRIPKNKNCNALRVVCACRQMD
jgi:hypothetical protein